MGCLTLSRCVARAGGLGEEAVPHTFPRAASVAGPLAGTNTQLPLQKKFFFHVASEEDMFLHLGLDYLPPEQRNA